MPLKTNNPTSHKHPKHYAKVYWPYLPLVLILGVGLWLGHPSSERAQRGTLSYATNVNNAQLLASTNRQRSSHGKPVLTVNSSLVAAATAEAQDIANHNSLTTNASSTQTAQALLANRGYQFQTASQNLAFGFDSSDQAVKGWLNSAASRDTLLNEDFQQVGFGTAQSQNLQNNGPTTVIVAMYAQPANGSLRQAAIMGLNQQPFQDATTSISKVQTLTDGHAPWIGLAVAILGIACIAFLILKHGLAVRRSWRRGQKFVLSHPVFDLTIVALAAVCALLCQSVGFVR